jgi:hypothetical protein
MLADMTTRATGFSIGTEPAIEEELSAQSRPSVLNWTDNVADRIVVGMDRRGTDEQETDDAGNEFLKHFPFEEWPGWVGGL